MISSSTYLGQSVTVHIDRPLGSLHPKWNFEYEVNYGYIPDTLSGDGEELDAYVLGIYTPLQTFEGVCIAVIRRIEEDDDKLIIVPNGVKMYEKEIREKIYFQEKWFKIEVKMS